jgi:pimeloyl-ACP methyl ester carboxylesterase
MDELTVSGTDGVRLAVFAEGHPDSPTVVLVHGYPDTHVVWDPVAEALRERFRVVRYDVRGAGRSDAPRGLRPYRLPALADDLFAVIAAVSPDRPVHVVGHDWGSVQAWEAVTDPRAPGRIAGFTSASGPCLDHVAHWAKRRRRRPTATALRQLLSQYRHSWYVYAFHLPGFPTLAWWWLAPRWHRQRDGGRGPAPEPTLRADGIRGIRLYRANVLPRMLRPRQRTALVPVHLITILRDEFITPAVLDEVEHWAPDLRRDTIDARHFSALHAHAPTFAALVTDFATQQDPTPR